jgi:hypothetical protein
MAKDSPVLARGEPKKAATNELIGVNSEIGRKLRQYYDGIVSEQVPDRFAQLLAQLEQVEQSRKPE